MLTRPVASLAMIGPALDTRGGTASLVCAWREQGLFRRWPMDYIATRAEASPAQNARLLAQGLRRFAALLARQGRMAVHVHLGARGLWREAPFIALALAARCPLVVQLHGGGFARYYDGAGAPLRAALAFAFQQAAYVVAPCESLRAWVHSVAREAEAICVPPGVAVPAPVRTEKHDPGERQNLVLFLGRLEAAKGVFDLLEALVAVRAAVPDVRLVCAGEGDRAAVARVAARLGIGDALKFAGTVGPSGKRALLESAALFALPSYDEGVPQGLLEAMSAGLPVIASPVGGVPDAVVDGVSGFFAAPGDRAGLARLLKRLLADRALAARVGAAARETVRRRFAAERSVAAVEALYADLGLKGERSEPPRGGERDLRQAA